jgi:branched-chain amino acid transport system ATP-binding protein
VVDEAMALLETLRLTGDASRGISELPYGRQRLVELAIALGLRPEVLLLDEAAAGVPSAESHIILDAVAAPPAHIAEGDRPRRGPDLLGVSPRPCHPTWCQTP